MGLVCSDRCFLDVIFTCLASAATTLFLSCDRNFTTTFFDPPGQQQICSGISKICPPDETFTESPEAVTAARTEAEL
jgi:hypothetical protein